MQIGNTTADGGETTKSRHEKILKKVVIFFEAVRIEVEEKEL